METFELYLEKYSKPLLLNMSCIWVAKYRWQFSSTLGAYTVINGKKVTLLAMLTNGNLSGNMYLTNGNPVDYRMENIRKLEVNQSQHQKIEKGMSSKYRGVSYNPERQRKPWLAQKSCQGVRVLQKYFATEIEAAMAYNQATIKCLGHEEAFFNHQLNEFVH
jgi:hypothetical protein